MQHPTDCLPPHHSSPYSTTDLIILYICLITYLQKKTLQQRGVTFTLKQTVNNLAAKTSRRNLQWVKAKGIGLQWGKEESVKGTGGTKDRRRHREMGGETLPFSSF